MTDDFDQDPEESPESVPEEEEEEVPNWRDLDSSGYHDPSQCFDPDCGFRQCDDYGADEEKYPGEDIWWKTNDNWKKGL